HTGETFFVKVRLSKAGDVMTAAHFDAMQIWWFGAWHDGSALGVSFEQDGDDLLYYFPASQMPGGFPIEDAEWSWNFRFQYAATGVYTATAEVIPAYQAGLANPDVYAVDAISTTVTAAPPPQATLLLLGP